MGFKKMREMHSRILAARENMQRVDQQTKAKLASAEKSNKFLRQKTSKLELRLEEEVQKSQQLEQENIAQVAKTKKLESQLARMKKKLKLQETALQTHRNPPEEDSEPQAPESQMLSSKYSFNRSSKKKTPKKQFTSPQKRGKKPQGPKSVQKVTSRVNHGQKRSQKQQQSLCRAFLEIINGLVKVQTEPLGSL